jgi:hypothetical protein
MRLFGPVYGISQRKRIAAAEWRTGIETLEITDAMMTASLSVQVPLYLLDLEIMCIIPGREGREIL